MTIDFTLSKDQKKVQMAARDFAENVLAPVVRAADLEVDPLKAFQMTKPAYVEAYKQGIAFGMLPKEYGGGGLTNVELILAAEEICAVDPGFACTVLVNGLALMPVWYWGTEEQKRRIIGAATSDPDGEWLAGYAASEPAGQPGGTANFDNPAPFPAGIGVTAVRYGDEYILNGKKYWPCNVGGWDGQGANVNLVVVRTDQEKGGTSGLSAVLVERGTPGVTYNIIDSFGHRLTPNSEIIFEDARIPAANLVEGTLGNGDLLINRNFAWSGPVAAIAAVGVARSAYEAA
ncbi:MAG TPA: acyl-CoA dehydrogenase family protein, partial [Jatrophihabitantaceae bacterium]|nr:acyl-CoA dehydrogenase family protein [Jatrophihabitantaceae bacterium]